MKWWKDKEWWAKAFDRAIRTVAQTALATIGSEALVMSDVKWLTVASAALLGGVCSILTSIAGGMPEYKEGNNEQ